VAFALDLELHLVQMPFVTQACTAPTQSCGVARAELRAPGPHSLVRDHHATLGQQLLDVAQAQTEADVQPHRMADDLSGVPIATVGRGLGQR
jgi:hypothetical protein